MLSRTTTLTTFRISRLKASLADLQKLLLLRSLFSQQRRIGNISDTLIQSLGQTAQLWRTWTPIGTLIGMTGVMRRERLPLRFWRHV